MKNVRYNSTYIQSVSLSLFQFTFDKDGKVIDATLPIVSGFERNVLPNGKHLCLFSWL